MAQYRRYSDADRAQALAVLDLNEGNMLRTAQQTGIPRATLQEWAAGRVPDSMPELRQEAKKDLAVSFKDFAGRVIGLTTDEDIKAASLRDRFMAAGVAVDKYRLLTDQPTTITGQELSEDESVARLRELVQRGRSRRPGLFDPAGTPGVRAPDPTEPSEGSAGGPGLGDDVGSTGS